VLLLSILPVGVLAPLFFLCLLRLFHTHAYTCLFMLPAFAHFVQSLSLVSSSSSMPVGYGPMHYELPPTVRGGLCVHRPSDDCDHLVLSKKRKVTASVGPTRKRACPDDEHFLQYLTMRHQGNVETAQLSLLVASSAGRGKFHCDKNDNAVIPSTHMLHDSIPSSSVSAQARSH
jgi:hypothetical protein